MWSEGKDWVHSGNNVVLIALTPSLKKPLPQSPPLTRRSYGVTRLSEVTPPTRAPAAALGPPAVDVRALLPPRAPRLAWQLCFLLRTRPPGSRAKGPDRASSSSGSGGSSSKHDVAAQAQTATHSATLRVTRLRLSLSAPPPPLPPLRPRLRSRPPTGPAAAARHASHGPSQGAHARGNPHEGRASGALPPQLGRCCKCSEETQRVTHARRQTATAM